MVIYTTVLLPLRATPHDVMVSQWFPCAEWAVRVPWIVYTGGSWVSTGKLAPYWDVKVEELVYEKVNFNFIIDVVWSDNTLQVLCPLYRISEQ